MSKSNNMAMVLQALKNAGLNDNQARILAAEIGRENGFQSRYLWGYHSDPANKAKNIGLISWQGSRADGVENALKSAGLLKDGKIEQNQASLDVQARYLVNEIRNNPSYAETKKKFLDNPNVDYATGHRVLGKNFIRWAYDNKKYASGHAQRDRYYKELGGIVPQVGEYTQDTTTLAQYQPQNPTIPPIQEPQIPVVPTTPQVTSVFGGVNSNNLFAGAVNSTNLFAFDANQQSPYGYNLFGVNNE